MAHVKARTGKGGDGTEGSDDLSFDEFVRSLCRATVLQSCASARRRRGFHAGAGATPSASLCACECGNRRAECTAVRVT